MAATEATVLVTGETGTGKELLARFIHRHSTRQRGVFVAVNCGAIPRELAESEFFGYRKGAFSGAAAHKKGYFQIADGGTLFLDEVGEAPPDLQVKFLRVLQDREIWPVGAEKPARVDVRVIASTNRDLAAEVREGRFREDLFFRLNVISLRIPPLRERREDIPPLVASLLERSAAKSNRRPPSLSDEALAVLAAYAWPGNVRQLENELERLALLSEEGARIPATQISPYILQEVEAAPAGPIRPAGPAEDAARGWRHRAEAPGGRLREAAHRRGAGPLRRQPHPRRRDAGHHPPVAAGADEALRAEIDFTAKARRTQRDPLDCADRTSLDCARRPHGEMCRFGIIGARRPAMKHPLPTRLMTGLMILLMGLFPLAQTAATAPPPAPRSHPRAAGIPPPPLRRRSGSTSAAASRPRNPPRPSPDSATGPRRCRRHPSGSWHRTAARSPESPAPAPANPAPAKSEPHVSWFETREGKITSGIIIAGIIVGAVVYAACQGNVVIVSDGGTPRPEQEEIGQAQI